MVGKSDAPNLCALGLMSGTSLDGVDIAQLTTEGKNIRALGPSATIPYNEETRQQLLAVLGESKYLESTENMVTEAYISAIRTFLATNPTTIDNIDVIGVHGQTIMHAPHLGQTIQIGDPQSLASEFNTTVVGDFRSNDVAHGGEGAPLAPVFHRALSSSLKKPIAILNIGGVANLTWVDHNSMIAFDTGPGNALLDDWVAEKTEMKMDKNGKLGETGIVSRKALEKLLNDPFFSLPAPKSLDRNHFKTVSRAALKGLNLQDGAATLTAFTSEAISMGAKQLPKPPCKWLVSGGGRKNKTLMGCLQKSLSAPVDPVEVVGWSGDSLEAQLMGFLAVRTLRNLPLSYPMTTGVPFPMKGGVLFPSPQN